MPSEKHEAALDFAIHSLGHGDWQKRGFRRDVFAALKADPFTCVLEKDTPDDVALPTGWIPDAFRIDREKRLLELIEVGKNSEEKWQAIVRWAWWLDCEGWAINMYGVDKETLHINQVSDSELLTMYLVRLQRWYTKKQKNPECPTDIVPSRVPDAEVLAALKSGDLDAAYRVRANQ